MLTKEQLKELKNSISNIENQLNSTDNQIEKEKIYNDAIETFNSFGLLPDDVSINHAQKLVTGKVQNPKIVKSIEKWYSKHKGTTESDENFLCSITGNLDLAFFMGPLGQRILKIGDKIVDMVDNHYYLAIFLDLLFAPFYLLYIPIAIFWIGFPYCVGCEVGIGFIQATPMGNEKSPSRGYINTDGLNGSKNWDGRLWGKIPRSKIINFYFISYPGVLGFTGVRIGYCASSHFVGSALWARVKKGANP
jgi:hypothetical protein